MKTQSKTPAKKPAKKSAQTFELATIDVKQLPQLQGWKDKLLAIVKENPVIEVTDKESYEAAKKSRLALREGRYEIQNQDKDIARILKDLRTQAGNVSAELIEIVLPTETDQDAKIKVWEALEKERLDKKRLEEEARKDAIKETINTLYADFKAQLKATDFSTISEIKEALEELETRDREEFQEFEVDYLETVDRLRELMEERVEELHAAEAQRKAAEAARQAAEKANKEAAIAKRNSERMQKLAPVFSYGPAVDMGKVFEMTDTTFEEFLHTKTDSKKQADQLAQEEKDQLAEYRRQQEEARQTAEAERQAAEAKAIEVVEEEVVGSILPEGAAAKLAEGIDEEEIEDVDFEEPVAEAPKRLSQDQNKLVMFISNIAPQLPATGLKSDAAKRYVIEITEELDAFKKRLLTGIENL